MDEHRQRESLSFDRVAKKKPKSRYLKWGLENPLIVCGYILIVLLCIVGIIGANIGSQSGVIERADVGKIAEHDYKAPQDKTFKRVDKDATAKNREQRVAAVLPIYNWDTTYHDTVIARIRAAFQQMRTGMEQEQERLSATRVARTDDSKLLQNDENHQQWADSLLFRFHDSDPLNEYVSTRPINQAEIADGIVAWFISHQKDFEKSLGYEISEEMFIWLSSQQFSSMIEEGILQVMDAVLGRMIVTSREEIESIDAFVVQWFELGEKRQRRMDQTEQSNISTLVSSENLIYTLLRERFAQAPESFFLYFKQFVRTNVTYDETSTQRERQNVSDKTPELVIVEEFKKGQTIVGRGDPIKLVHYEIFQQFAEGQTDTDNTVIHWISLSLVTVLMAFMCWRSILATTSRRQKNRDVVYVATNVLLYVAFLRICTILSGVLDSVYHWPFSALLLFPFASVPMILRIIVSRYYAYLISVCCAVLTGIIVEDNLVTIYGVMSMMAGCLLTERPKRSNVLIQRGLTVGIVSGLTALAVYMLRGSNMSVMDNVVVTLLGLASGLISTGVAMIGLPLAESLFGYVTSNKLLELSNLEHPALKTLFLEAPGTYQHSIMVGSLNEAAAEAIGANAILARVGGYYHDIGKVKNAQYFAENQRGDNPHNRLKPNMSALILKAHERDGLDIARKYKLPQDIMDFIATHHGTSRIEYFYQRAKEQQDRVYEEDYRYPGPRPQTRETGICMVSDMVEAAVRSLPDKSPDKILVLVRKLINHKFTDGQFDECDLTLRDLNDIANALLGILNAFYHHRPEYPDQKKEREKLEAEKKEKLEAEKKAAADLKSDKQVSSKVIPAASKSEDDKTVKSEVDESKSDKQDKSPKPADESSKSDKPEKDKSDKKDKSVKPAEDASKSDKKDKSDKSTKTSESEDLKNDKSSKNDKKDKSVKSDESDLSKNSEQSGNIAETIQPSSDIKDQSDKKIDQPAETPKPELQADETNPTESKASSDQTEQSDPSAKSEHGENPDSEKCESEENLQPSDAASAEKRQMTEDEEADELLKEDESAVSEEPAVDKPVDNSPSMSMHDTYELTFSSKVDVFKKS